MTSPTITAVRIDSLVGSREGRGRVDGIAITMRDTRFEQWWTDYCLLLCTDETSKYMQTALKDVPPVRRTRILLYPIRGYDGREDAIQILISSD
jgi:hypothetical protein